MDLINLEIEPSSIHKGKKDIVKKEKKSSLLPVYANIVTDTWSRIDLFLYETEI